MRLAIDILYEDEALVLLNKPAGLLSIPDRFVPEKPNLLHWLRERYDQVYTVHRLDRETSGVICFARTEADHRNLSIQFEQRSVRKFYRALLDGRITPDKGIIDQPILPHPTRPGLMMPSKRGKAATTSYRLLEQWERFSWVEAEILTGRTHQIRVHFQSIGFPLSVDAAYGKREELLLSEIKGKRYRLGKNKTERPLLSRSSLHAYLLELTHPRLATPLAVKAPLPKDINAVLNQLRKWNK